MKLGIIGRGVVGQTIQLAFANFGHEIHCYDKIRLNIKILTTYCSAIAYSSVFQLTWSMGSAI